MVCAFIRGRSQRDRPSDDEIDEIQAKFEQILSDETEEPEGRIIRMPGFGRYPQDRMGFPRTPQDIEEAVKILGRRGRGLGTGENHRLDLRGANLCGLTLREVNLQGADLRGALMIDARVSQSNFTQCRFDKADLRFSVFSDTHLVQAHFRTAKVQHARFFFWSFGIAWEDLAAEQVMEDGRLTWRVGTTKKEPRIVEGGRNLFESDWEGAIFKRTWFSCQDLSGMRGVSRSQFTAMVTDEDVKPPPYLDAKSILVMEDWLL